MLKVDLMTFPYFFSPRGGGREPQFQERVMSRFAPNMGAILNGYLRSGMDIVALSSCHTATSGMDNRFADYLKQLSPHDPFLFWDYDEGKGLLFVERRHDERKLLVVHGQKVRAYEGETPWYVNVIGTGHLVTPGRSVEDTLADARDRGCLALLCDPLSQELHERSVDLVKANRADGVCLGSYGNLEATRRLANTLRLEKVPVVPVSGSHGYKTAGISYIELSDIENPDVEYIRESIIQGGFMPHQGHVSRWTRFRNRDIHIYLSVPFHLLAGGKRKKEVRAMQKARGKSAF